MTAAITCAPIEGVDPSLWEAVLRQKMAAAYMKAVPDLAEDEARAAAVATWETEWPNDPDPRTLEDALETVREDLQYWEE